MVLQALLSDNRCTAVLSIEMTARFLAVDYIILVFSSIGRENDGLGIQEVHHPRPIGMVSAHAQKARLSYTYCRIQRRA